MDDEKGMIDEEEGEVECAMLRGDGEDPPGCSSRDEKDELERIDEVRLTRYKYSW